MEKLIKENVVYILLITAVIFGGIYAVYHYGLSAFQSHSEIVAKRTEAQTKKEKMEELERQKAQDLLPLKNKADSGKLIYQVSASQFTPEASFGIMFENILGNIANSGVRIRSIDYNYQPTDDKILTANIQGYNACELSFTAVGSYIELQNFFKNLAKEKYLASIYEVYIEPYDNDKTILIAKFKIRLYTKTV